MRVFPHHERCPPCEHWKPVFGGRFLVSDVDGDELETWPVPHPSPLWWREHGCEPQEAERAAQGLWFHEGATGQPGSANVDSRAHSARQGG